MGRKRFPGLALVRPSPFLCSGHFGVVRLCMDKSTGKKYAVKMILKAGNMDLGRLRKEVDIMKKAGRHPNIVALLDVFEDDDCMYLVME